MKRLHEDRAALLLGIFPRNLKKRFGLIPLIGFIGLGLGSAALYLLRLAIYSPDVRSQYHVSRCPGYSFKWKDAGYFPRAPQRDLWPLPDSWDKKNNPEPWNKLNPNDQYKFMAVSTDYKNLKKDRPDF